MGGQKLPDGGQTEAYGVSHLLILGDAGQEIKEKTAPGLRARGNRLSVTAGTLGLSGRFHSPEAPLFLGRH